MTQLVKRNGNLFPSLITDVFESTPFFTPDFLNNWDFAVKIPSVNITDNAKNYLIELAAPGLDKKDFKIEIDNNLLTIRSEKEEEKNEENKNFKRREFSYSSFSRSFQLPENVASEKIDATYENGILKLSVPKKEMEASKQKKQIKIA